MTKYSWKKQPIYNNTEEPYVLKIVLSHVSRFETKTCLYYEEENKLSIVDNDLSIICSIQEAENFIEKILDFYIMPLYLK